MRDSMNNRHCESVCLKRRMTNFLCHSGVTIFTLMATIAAPLTAAAQSGAGGALNNQRPA
ncbi:MAG: hypothetical protein RL189_147, partial [Pseudomonadota bacterium]